MNSAGIAADIEAVRDFIQSCGIDKFHFVRRLTLKYRPLDLDSLVQLATASPRDSVVSSSEQSLFSTVSCNTGATTSTSLLSRAEPSPTGVSFPPDGSSTPPTEPSLPTGPPPPLETALNELEPEQTGEPTGRKFRCPFCSEYSPQRTTTRTFGRKPELKRHLLKYHATSVQWNCKIGSCDLSFDFRPAYEAHLRQHHDGLRNPDPSVNLCQQVVFACGFAKCRKLFEAGKDGEAGAVRISYFEHVLDHVVKGGDDEAWSYSRRMRNLLHQRAVEAAWKGRHHYIGRELAWQSQHIADHELSWRPQCSSMLRAMLECRHVPDAVLLCKFAVQLGSKRPTEAPPVLPRGFATPLLNTCRGVYHQPQQDTRFSSSDCHLQQEPRGARSRSGKRAARPGSSNGQDFPLTQDVHPSFHPQADNNASGAVWHEVVYRNGASSEAFPQVPFLASSMAQASFTIDLSSGQGAAIPQHFNFYNVPGSFAPLPQIADGNPNSDGHIFDQTAPDRPSKPLVKRNNVFTKLRCRRTSSSGSDTHMSEASSQVTMPTIPDQPPSGSMVSANTPFLAYQQ